MEDIVTDMPKGKKGWKYINKGENNYLQRTTDFDYTCNRVA
jgi:hypothetical protein